MVKMIKRVALLFIVFVFAFFILSVLTPKIRAAGDIYSASYLIFDSDIEDASFILGPDESINNYYLASEHAGVITSYGRVFMWGKNDWGQVGDGTTENKDVPVDISPIFDFGEDEEIIELSLGEYSSSALTNKGNVYAWGSNVSYNLGNGTDVDSLTPIRITNNIPLNENEIVTKIEMGRSFTFALTNQNRVFGWGHNTFRLFVSNNDLFIEDPLDITDNFGLVAGERIVDISGGGQHALAYSSNNRVYSMGDNQCGQLGCGFEFDYNGGAIDITDNFEFEDEESIAKIEASYLSSFLLTSSGRVFTWGQNDFDQLGAIYHMDQDLPFDITWTLKTKIKDKSKIIDISSDHIFTYALSENGQVLVFGWNNSFTLGFDLAFVRFSEAHPFFGDIILEENEIITEIHTGSASGSFVTNLGNIYHVGAVNTGVFGIKDYTQVAFNPIKMKQSRLIDVINYDVEEGEEIPIPEAPTREGYTFVGWTVDGELYDFSNKMPSKNLELIPKFEEKGYELKLNPNGGTLSCENPFIKHKSLVILDNDLVPSRVGYTFIGWYESNDEGKTFIGLRWDDYNHFMPKRDVTLYALYDIELPVVSGLTYKKNGKIYLKADIDNYVDNLTYSFNWQQEIDGVFEDIDITSDEFEATESGVYRCYVTIVEESLGSYSGNIIVGIYNTTTPIDNDDPGNTDNPNDPAADDPDNQDDDKYNTYILLAIAGVCFVIFMSQVIIIIALLTSKKGPNSGNNDNKKKEKEDKKAKKEANDSKKEEPIKLDSNKKTTKQSEVKVAVDDKKKIENDKKTQNLKPNNNKDDLLVKEIKEQPKKQVTKVDDTNKVVNQKATVEKEKILPIDTNNQPKKQEIKKEVDKKTTDLKVTSKKDSTTKEVIAKNTNTSKTNNQKVDIESKNQKVVSKDEKVTTPKPKTKSEPAKKTQPKKKTDTNKEQEAKEKTINITIM